MKRKIENKEFNDVRRLYQNKYNNIKNPEITDADKKLSDWIDAKTNKGEPIDSDVGVLLAGGAEPELIDLARKMAFRASISNNIGKGRWAILASGYLEDGSMKYADRVQFVVSTLKKCLENVMSFDGLEFMACDGPIGMNDAVCAGIKQWGEIAGGRSGLSDNTGIGNNILMLIKVKGSEDKIQELNEKYMLALQDDDFSDAIYKVWAGIDERQIYMPPSSIIEACACWLDLVVSEELINKAMDTCDNVDIRDIMDSKRVVEVHYDDYTEIKSSVKVGDKTITGEMKLPRIEDTIFSLDIGIDEKNSWTEVILGGEFSDDEPKADAFDMEYEAAVGKRKYLLN